MRGNKPWSPGLFSRLQEQSYWAGRIDAQLSVAEELLSLHPEHAREWGERLEEARARLGEGRDLAETCEAVESILAPLGPAAKAHTVYLVGHAHIDMNWMWSWPETVSLTVDSLSTVLSLMDEYPDFHFSQSQASVYRILEEYHPAMLERVAERVREGRWEVVASHWVEGDKNLAGGESLCRHLLYTRRYIQDLFGLSPEEVPIDWAPDTFGHAATMPTYLARGGVRYTYLHRYGVHTPHRHDLFRWRGPDGSTVLVRNEVELICNGEIEPIIARHWRSYIRRSGLKEFMFLYGVGDHGGGPTRRDLECGLDMATWPIFPTMTFSTAQRFFETVDKQPDLPVYEGELNTEFAGCYTSQAIIKKAHRYSEARLADAEFASFCGSLRLGRPYPFDRLEENWRRTLFLQFHDILPGSCVHDTRTHAHGQFQETMASTSMIETVAWREFAKRIDTASVAGPAPTPGPCPVSHYRSGQGGGAGIWTREGNLSTQETAHRQGDRPFVLVNTTPVEREEIVEVVLWDHAPPAPAVALKDAAFTVRAPDGTEFAAMKSGHGTEWGHAYVKVSFPARVPAWGYAAYVVREGKGETLDGGARLFEREHYACDANFERRPLGIENERLRLEIDPQTGGIRRLTGRDSGTAVIEEDGPAEILLFDRERPNKMSSWLIEHAGRPIPVRVREIRPGLRGRCRASVEVDVAFGESTFTLTYELRRNDPRLYLSLKGLWFERGSAETGIPSLRLRLPFAFGESRALYEIPFGGLERPLHNNEEVPALRWAMVRGAGEKPGPGCLVLNDCKHGHALDDSTLYVSLVRGGYFPDPLSDVGEHEMRFALLPLAEACDSAEATREAVRFNHPLRTIGAPVQQGPLPAEGSFLRLEGPGLAASGLKLAEDQPEDGTRALVVRIYETEGRQARGRIELDPALAGEIVGACTLDLLEREEGGEGLDITSSAVGFTVPPRGILSLKILLGALEEA